MCKTLCTPPQNGGGVQTPSVFGAHLLARKIKWKHEPLYWVPLYTLIHTGRLEYVCCTSTSSEQRVYYLLHLFSRGNTTCTTVLKNTPVKHNKEPCSLEHAALRRAVAEVPCTSSPLSLTRRAVAEVTGTSTPLATSYTLQVGSRIGRTCVPWCRGEHAYRYE